MLQVSLLLAKKTEKPVKSLSQDSGVLLLSCNYSLHADVTLLFENPPLVLGLSIKCNTMK